jgi:shikimate kinase
MKSNLTLIGMPGAGKSTVGIILAKVMSFGFVDTDILIQSSQKKSLQQIINESGHLNLRSIEERQILNLHVSGHVIATGGSAVYSNKAMEHLQVISEIIFLHVEYGDIFKRIHNFKTRGIAKSNDQTFLDLFEERQFLYEKYAHRTICTTGLGQEEIAEKIVRELPERHLIFQ